MCQIVTHSVMWYLKCSVVLQLTNRNPSLRKWLITHKNHEINFDTVHRTGFGMGCTTQRKWVNLKQDVRLCQKKSHFVTFFHFFFKKKRNWVYYCNKIIIFWLILGKVADISANPWDEFTFAVELDVAGKYWMFWTPDDETQTITFEVNKDK